MTQQNFFRNRKNLRGRRAFELGAERRAYVHKWLARNLSRLSTTTAGAMLLALPGFAEAAGNYVLLSHLANVVSIAQMPDGSLQLTLANGAVVAVPASDVSMINGQLGVSVQAAEIISEVGLGADPAPQSGGGGGGGGGAGLGAAAGGLALAGVGAAAGGKGGDSGPAPVDQLNLSNVLSSGFSNTNTGFKAPENASSVSVTIGDATYTSPVGNDGSWSITLTETQAQELAQGRQEVSITAKDASNTSVGSGSATFDIDTLGPNVPSVSLETDSGRAGDALTNSADLSLSATEPGATRSFVVNGVQQGDTYTAPSTDGTYTVEVTDTDAAGNVGATGSVTFTLDGTAPVITLNPISEGAIDLIDARDGLNVTGTASGAEVGQTVHLTFNGTAYTAMVETGGAFSVPIPASAIKTIADQPGDTAMVTVSATVTDVAGNTSATALMQAPADFSGPTVSIATVSGDNTLNSSETTDSVTISGQTTNVKDGQAVQVVINGIEVPNPPEVSSGAWSVEITPSAYRIETNGTYDITADVSSAGGIPAAQANQSITTDTTGPELSINSLIASDNIVNSAEAEAGVSISGTTTAPDNQTVTVSLGGDGTYTALVQNGQWSTTIPHSALADGQIISVTANVTDAAGNPATPATAQFETDFTAPTVAITPLSVGAALDAVEQDQDLTISGTSQGAEPGQTVTVALGDLTATASTAANGTWTAEFTAAQLHTLADKSSLMVTADLSDSHGNAAQQATVSLQTDFAPTIQMNPINNAGAFLIEKAQSDGLLVSGSAIGMSAGETITIKIGDAQAATAAVNASGDWSTEIPGTAFEAITDKQTISVSAQDSAEQATPSSQTMLAMAAPDYMLVELSRTADSVTMGVVMEHSFDASNGIGVQFTLGFDPTIANFTSATAQMGGLTAINSGNAAEGSVTIGYIKSDGSGYSAGEPVLTFNMGITDDTKPLVLDLDAQSGGDSFTVLGSDQVDNLPDNATNTDFGIIKAAGGDDQIDLSGTAPRAVIFEADPTANGHDTITNFNTAATEDMGDLISIQIDDTSILRGTGAQIETLAEGSQIGTNTGLVTFTTQLSDLSATSMATAAESLVGESAGDVIYMLASDGTDTALAQVTYSGTDAASAQIMATFTGVESAIDMTDNTIFPQSYY